MATLAEWIDYLKANPGKNISDDDRLLVLSLGYQPGVFLVRRVSIGHWHRMDTDEYLGEWSVDQIGVPIVDASDALDSPPNIYAYADGVNDRAWWYLPILMRVSRPGEALFVQRNIRRNGPYIEQIGGLQPLKSETAFKEAMDYLWDALFILRGEIASRGRPTGAHVSITGDDRLKAYCEMTYEEDRRPTYAELADHFYVSKKTIERRIRELRSAGVQWPPASLSDDF